MSSRCRIVMAFLASSRLAMVRSGKKSRIFRSTLSSLPSRSAIAIRVLMTDLVLEYMRCLRPAWKGA